MGRAAHQESTEVSSSVTNQIEASFTPVEVFESAETKSRREWAEAGGDWAWQVLKFLQGRRQNEISLSEILTTQTYMRSTQREKDALRFVATQAEQKHPITGEDRRRLKERDDFLMKFVAGESLGRGDWVSEIQNIPATVPRAQEVDASLFQKTYRAPKLFSYLWERR